MLLDKPLSTESLPESKRLIYDAIKAGHCFIGYDFLADSMGFTFMAETRGSPSLLMGDEAPFESGTELLISVPQQANIRLIYNGGLLHSANGKTVRLPIDQPGVYRIEVYYKDQPWIFSNPLFFRAKT